MKVVLILCFFILAIWGLASYWICELRRLYRRFSWYVLAIILINILLLFSLLTCDPDLAKRTIEISIGLFLGLVVYVLVRQVKKMWQAEYP